MALISQVRRLSAAVPARRTALLAVVGVAGAALFLGDSMITPSISVLSAVQGVETIQPSLHAIVVPVTVVIIVVLFVLQRVGSGTVGRLFGPVMLVWFVTIAALGVRGITMHPAVLRALSPVYAVDSLFGTGATGFLSLTTVVLAFTGVEALYADLGHFGRSAITRAWLALVFPACILSYLGQEALVVAHPSAIGSPFFTLMPRAGLIPLVLLATAATVIASQAVITGAFSLARQAAQLRYLPRMRVVHTSAREYGQVYVPVVNWTLMAAVVALVVAFGSSASLAFAYGTAVSGTLITTTILFFFLARQRWRRPPWLVAAGAGLFGVIELAFVAANLTKIPHGAWFPLAVAVVLFTVMVTWFRGSELVGAARTRIEGSLEALARRLGTDAPPVARVPGTGIFMSRGQRTVPLSMRACVDRLHALPQHAIIVSIESVPNPRVRAADRFDVHRLGPPASGITLIRARYGYAEHANVPALVKKIAEAGVAGPLDTRDISFYVSKLTLRVGDRPGMRRWRKRLFLATGVIAAPPEDSFRLPRKHTITLGSEIEF